MKYILHALFLMSLLFTKNLFCSASSGSSYQSYLTGYTSEEYESEKKFNESRKSPISNTNKKNPDHRIIIGPKPTKTPNPVHMHFGDLRTPLIVGKKVK